MWIGVISNTEGFVSAEVTKALHGVDYIIHCGGVGTWEVIEELSKVARVTGVVGPNDDPALIPFERALTKTFGGTTLYTVHRLGDPLDLPQAVAREIQKIDPRIVLFAGNASFNNRLDGRLFFCPGAAGKKKPRGGRSVGMVEIDGQSVRGEIIPLKD
jgi:predicted phosphodiesterase